MEIPLFPLSSVLFPGALMPLVIFEPRYRQMIGRCMDEDIPFGIVLIKSGVEVGGAAEPHAIGVTARIEKLEPTPDSKINILAAGHDRFRILSTANDRPYLTGEVELLEEIDGESGPARLLAEQARERFGAFHRLTLALRGEWSRQARTPVAPGRLADHIASRLPVSERTRQRLLELLVVPERLETVSQILDTAIEELTPRAAAISQRRYHGFSVSN